MKQSFTYGSVRGAPGNRRSYRDPLEGGVEYAVRFAFKSDSTVKATARLCDETGKTDYARQSTSVEKGDWRQWDFTFKAPRTDLKVKLEITFDGPGTLWVGSASLKRGDHFHNMRRDVIARWKEMSAPIIRWPGGNFSGDYVWKEGLLPLDQRPPMRACWANTLSFTDHYDFHEVGTDEYIALCRELGAEPCISVNMGKTAGGAQNAADWVEYCNGSPESKWGKLRAERGHKEPYHVKHWSFGNEMYGCWMIGACCDGPTYAKQIAEYAAAMRKVDPSLVFIASGGFDKYLVDNANVSFDWLSIHHYADEGGTHHENPPLEEYARMVRNPETVCLQRLRDAAGLGTGGKRIGLSLDEWNIWHDWFGASQTLTWRVNPIDGAFAAAMLNMLARNAEPLNITFGAMFQPINEGAIAVKPFSAELTTIGQVFALDRTHHGARIIRLANDAGGPDIDALASCSEDGRHIAVTMINRNPTSEKPVKLALANAGRIKQATLKSLSARDLKPNVPFDEHVASLAIGAANEVSLVVPRFGVVLVTLRTE